nr:VRR-NUC domain-containing protein [Yimella sp. NH-Cas1]
MRCRERGLLSLKLISPGRAGVPDRVIVAPGGTVFVELKRPGGRLRRLQHLTITKLRRDGGEVFVVETTTAADELVEALASRVAAE